MKYRIVHSTTEVIDVIEDNPQTITVTLETMIVDELDKALDKLEKKGVNSKKIKDKIEEEKMKEVSKEREN